VTTPHLAGHPAASQQAIVDAALLMLDSGPELQSELERWPWGH